ncbi:MAG: iron-sulfur cluster assembly scaffold protein [Dehalococcoidia bacterium]|nr:iron-sulfur cluster assembly scaffold protein [Dehalococcoidia bacterium]
MSHREPSAPSLDELRKTFSARAMGHMLNPKNLGEFRMADGVGQSSIPCGDSMQISLRVRDGRILEAKFTTEGCGPVIACGSVATELVKGKTVNEAMALTVDDITAGLDGLPDSEAHCAALAVNALKQALVDYLALRREPWKKPYRQVGPVSTGGG